MMMMNRIQIAIKNTPHLIEESECPIVNAGLGFPKEALGSLHSNKDGSHGQLRREDLLEAVNYDEGIFLKQFCSNHRFSQQNWIQHWISTGSYYRDFPEFTFSKNLIAFQSYRRIA